MFPPPENLPVNQAIILRQFNRGLKPEFGLPVSVVHMHMEARFLSREEKESESTLTEDSRAQRLFFPHLTFRMTRREAVGVDAVVSGHVREIASNKDGAHGVQPQR